MGCLQEDTWLCNQCLPTIPGASSVCLGCEQPTVKHLLCYHCSQQFGVQGVISAGHYHHPLLQRGIHWLKFKGIRAVAPPLASLLLTQLHTIAPLSSLVQQAILVPIPLHPRRQRQRGFNQSEEIARTISTLTGIPLIPLLIRTRATWAQATLPPVWRRHNVTAAFSAAALPPPDRPVIILVDDVTTTGATLAAAATALIPYTIPATRLWGATIARG